MARYESDPSPNHCATCRCRGVSRLVEYDDDRNAAWANLVRVELQRMEREGLVVAIPRGGARRSTVWARSVDGVPSPAIQVTYENTGGRLRLHRSDGPAVVTSNGADFYWHGVRVPERVVMAPERLDLYDVITERNAEVRRIVIERIGLPRLMAEAHAEEIHRDDFGVLWRIPLAGSSGQSAQLRNALDELGRIPESAIRWDRIRAAGDSRVPTDLMVVQVVNATPEPDGSYQDFLLLVDARAYGGLKTAHDAVASTWRIPVEDLPPERWPLAFEDPAEYDPAVQT